MGWIGFGLKQTADCIFYEVGLYSVGLPFFDLLGSRPSLFFVAL